MTYRTARTTIAQPTGSVEVERAERLPPATHARMLENLWVGAGAAGWVVAAYIGYELLRNWPVQRPLAAAALALYLWAADTRIDMWDGSGL